ncbi:hypothetical protein MSP8887_03863 [Marinomonas spartinae]|uniref:Uncharacterized protein n=1 Tax=Marinomonas spartinae TaxID=1792290 RepID=A0A1A8TIK9_9GAMM|nr:hypothetical protein [Marinomonas spartinae]SBS33535.1 hypothetical protein MSP8886_02784 [Marinomonas spartinae]SBS39520.1 hypothetical protein MSP8887_03863 [Marinomonas spartinae]
MGISNMVSNMDDEDLLIGVGASGYNEATKSRILKSIRNSDSRTKSAKKKYGNGISVKGIIVNISGEHYLRLREKKRESGKDWSDPEVLAPDNEIGPCQAGAFFHAKRDAAATGTRGGFVYEVQDNKSFIKGKISIAWENPWDHVSGGPFVSCIRVSRDTNLLPECLDWCASNRTSKLDSDLTIPEGKELKRYIDVSVLQENKTTAYLVVSIQTNDLVKEVFEDFG